MIVPKELYSAVHIKMSLQIMLWDVIQYSSLVLALAVVIYFAKTTAEYNRWQMGAVIATSLAICMAIMLQAGIQISTAGVYLYQLESLTNEQTIEGWEQRRLESPFKEVLTCDQKKAIVCFAISFVTLLLLMSLAAAGRKISVAWYIAIMILTISIALYTAYTNYQVSAVWKRANIIKPRPG